MFIVTVEGVDYSRHSQESDAQVQKERCEDHGMTNVAITEKDTFEPE